MESFGDGNRQVVSKNLGAESKKKKYMVNFLKIKNLHDKKKSGWVSWPTHGLTWVRESLNINFYGQKLNKKYNIDSYNISFFFSLVVLKAIGWLGDQYENMTQRGI